MTNQTTIAKGEIVNPSAPAQAQVQAPAPAAPPTPAKVAPAKALSPVPTTPVQQQAKPPAPAQTDLAERWPPVPDKPDPLLVTILRTKRAHGSAGDTNFRLWLHKEIERSGAKLEILAEGCIMVRTDLKSDTLFSCHVDTCHGQRESDGGAQDLAYDPGFGDILLAEGSTSGCLGADDGAGIYIMLKMIKAKVPGSYLFHTGEEQGGVGSRAVLVKHKPLLENFSRAIAFDRAVQRGGAPEVIITQGGQACASVEAGQALCTALNKSGAIFEKDYIISHGGSFTDTKVYKSVIDECFNLGVFYAAQHSNREWLNVAGLEQLLQACLVIKWDDLPVIRKPVPDTVYQQPAQQKTYKAPNGAYQGHLDDQQDFREWFQQGGNAQPPAKNKKVTGFPKAPSVIEELDVWTRDDIQAVCEESPEVAAALIAALYAKVKAAKAEVETLQTFIGLN